jgi:hypothetical protein
MLEAVSLSEIREFDIIFRDQNFNMRKALVTVFTPWAYLRGPTRF